MLEEISIHAFIQKHQIKNEQGQLIDFHNHLFLFDIYKDFSKKLAVIKAAQIGMTTCEILKSLWGVKNKGMDAIYILPTDTDVNSMVGSKVNRIIAQNPILQKWTKDKDSITQKQIGDNYIHYRGSWSEKQAIMVTSSWNCYKKGTEVLTKIGWKKVEDIVVNDRIATYEKGNIKYYKPEFVIRMWAEKIHNYESSNFKLSVTPDHRMFINKNGWKVDKSENIIDGGKFYLGIADTKLKAKCSDTIKLREKRKGKVYEKEYNALYFYKLLGWFLSEGSVNKHKGVNRGKINISQEKNEKHIKDIEDTLNKLGMKWWYSGNSFTFTDWALALFLEKLGNSKEKYIPDEILYKPKYLPLLLRSLYDGDAFHNDHTEYLNTASKKLADTTQIAWLLLGKMASITEVEDRTCRMYRVGVRRHQKVQFNVYKNRNKSGRIVEEEMNEFVYCLNVKNHLIYVRDSKCKVPVICGQCYDEVDACKQDVVDQYSTRLQHSAFKWEHYFSHPSSVGTGIDKYWTKSDQKHWFIKCNGCKEEQYMEYPKSFDLKKEKYICKYCGKELTNEERRVGRWVKKYNDRDYSGYWIPLFIAPWVTAKEIITYQKEKSEEYFYNKVLGLPYIGGGNKLTKAHLMQNLTGDKIITPEDNERVVIGVDTGTNLYYVVGGKQGIFFYGQAKEYREIEDLMHRFTRSIVVIDQGGDLIGCRALREKYPGRVFLCLFGTDRKTQQLVRWGQNDEDGAVIADRNRSIQLVVDEFTDGRIPLQGNEDDWYDYYLHWNNLTRVKELDAKSGDIKRKIWVKNGQSDWSFATVYWRVGMSRFGGGETKIIGETKEVEDSPVIYPNMTMDAKWAHKPYERKGKIKDWREL